jgi:trimeric autotransporter adhesin
VRIGNGDVTSIGGQVDWSVFSDGRYKQNIREDVKGLSFISSLRPITYTVDINSLNEYYEKGRKHDSAYEKMKANMPSSADEASKIVYNGFIAQEVEDAAKKLNYDFSGVDKPKTIDGLYGLRYGDFVVPLVKAVQEQQQQIELLKKENKEMKAQLQKLTEVVLKK